MKKNMLRYFLGILLFGFLQLCLSIPAARADSPRHIGLAGAGRSGILQEALYSNPAALTYLNQSLAYGYYGLPRIPDWGAGGRQLTLGAYDGDNEYAKAGFAYERDSHAYLLGSGARAYRDRSSVLLGLGRNVTNFLDLGVTGKYVIRRDGGDESKFFDGNVGAMLKILAGTQIGITYENIANKEGETPPILGAGIRYDVVGSVALLVDGAYCTTGDSKKKRQWNYALELGLAGDLVGRGGIWQDSVVGIRGTAWGLSWQTPRTSFDYGVRMSSHAPVQREHVLGITIQI